MSLKLFNYVPGNFLKGDNPSALGQFITNELQKIGRSIGLLNQELAADEAAWTSYTPVVTAGSGTFTAASATGSYHQIGKTTFFEANITIATNGTAATSVVITLPVNVVAAKRFTGVGRVANGSVCFGFMNGLSFPTIATILKYDSTYPGADGVVIFFSGSYESV